MEQMFWNELKRLRYVQYQILEGPQGVSIRLADSTTEIVANSNLHDIRAARIEVMQQLLPWLKRSSDPCSAVVPYGDFALVLAESETILSYPEEDVSHWFDQPQVLGVDFEGRLDSIVQVACDHGVLIGSRASSLLRKVLSDRRHVHGVFGHADTLKVARPFDVQRRMALVRAPPGKLQWSLTDAASMVLFPRIRLVKDKTIHARVDWDECANSKTLTTEALQYAAADAILTRQLTHRLMGTK